MIHSSHNNAFRSQVINERTKVFNNLSIPFIIATLKKTNPNIAIDFKNDEDSIQKMTKMQTHTEKIPLIITTRFFSDSDLKQSG